MSAAGRPRREFRPLGGQRGRQPQAWGHAMSAALATFDHLVVAAATLADGIEYFAATTGATPHPGGKHVAMGTHNALAAPLRADVPRSHRDRS